MAIRISPNHKQASTHMPTLMKVIPKTTGDVAELGAGFFSTALLHWLCQGRRLYTYENDPEYYRMAKHFQSDTHRIRHLDDVDFDKHWSVVFIDHSTKVGGNAPIDHRQRGDDILKFKDVDIFILHDTEPGELEHYHYDLVMPLFKYRLDWTQTKPYTTVLSNRIDVTTW